MNFGAPELLILLAFVPVVAFALVAGHRWRIRVFGKLLSTEALAELVPSGALRARAIQVVLAIGAALALALAAARPQLGFEWVQRKAQGVNIVVVLDVSRSMDAQDSPPSRLEQARRELVDLLAMLRGDSVGLVLVANGAYLRLPLTTDYGTFDWVLKDTSTATIAAQGTSMAGGLEVATAMLQRAGGAGQAILVLSDGEFHDDPAALKAALDGVRAADAHVYSIGIGDAEGAPIPLAEGGFKKDRNGDMVLSRLDESQLRAIALTTGGAYVHSVSGDDDVRGIYEGEIRGKLQAQEREVRREQIPHERYQWPLGVAFVLLASHAAFGIAPGRRAAPITRGTAPAKVAALAFCVAAGLALTPAPAAAGTREDGLAAAERRDWAEAIDALGQARVAAPEDVEVGQALAEALYRAGRYRESEQVFTALAASDPEHRASHQYNAGNAAYRDGRLEVALNAFESARSLDGQLASAGKNAEAVRQEIALREREERQDAQPQEGEPQDGEPQDGEPQDGEPQDGQPQDGEPQDGQPQDGEPQDGQPQDGEPHDGQPEDADSGEHSTEVGEPQAGDPNEQGMSAADAARLVDGVKDGRPRVSIGGRDTEKDW